MRDYDLFVDGAWRTASGPRLERLAPGTRTRVATYGGATEADADAAVTSAHDAFQHGPWRATSAAGRSRVLFAIADALFEARDDLAKVESEETGKPLAHAAEDVDRGIDLWRYAAAALLAVHGESHVGLDGDVHAMTILEPVGVVALILPWNFPFVVCAERLPFILAAGCTVVCKPSELASGTALLTAEIASRAGLPDGVLNVVTGGPDGAGIPLVAHPKVKMISFTGSTENGRRVMEAAAKTLKRVSLELGGKSPIVVFADADLEAATAAIVSGFAHNAGQCCTSTTRLIVERTLAPRLEAMLIAALDKRVSEGPCQPTATDRQLERVREMIALGKREGRLVFGGGDAPGSPGAVLPTVFADLPSGSRVRREEIFGPVLTIDVFDDEAEAVMIANDTEYGLAGAVWTRDPRRAMRVVRLLRAGRLWINSPQDNYPELPIGGFGASGIGRETGSAGILTYSEVKTVVVR